MFSDSLNSAQDISSHEQDSQGANLVWMNTKNWFFYELELIVRPHARLSSDVLSKYS